MKLSYKLAAAFFCIAAGISVAAALPGLTAALAVGIALLLIGAVLAATSARQAAHCFREMRREEREQLKRNFDALQESVKQLDTTITVTAEQLRSSQNSGLQKIRNGMDEMTAALEQLSEIEDEVKKIAESGVAAAQRYDAGNRARLEQLGETITGSAERLRSSQNSGLQEIRNGMDEMTAALKQLSEIEDEVKKIAESGVDAAQRYDAGNRARLEQLGETITGSAERLRNSQKSSLNEVREGIDEVISRVDELSNDLENKLDDLADGVDDQTEQLEQLNERTGNIQEQGIEDVKAEVGRMREELEAQLGRTDAAVSAFKVSAKELEKGLEMFNQRTEITLNNADKAAQTQLQALQTFLKEENRENRDSTERIMKIYADLSEQDTRLLSALEPKGGK